MTEVTYLHAVPDHQPSPPDRVQLTRWQRKEVEGARALVMSAGELLASGRPDAYVVGLLEGAAANLLDILDAVCEVD
jgi:hypothetical protein